MPPAVAANEAAISIIVRRPVMMRGSARVWTLFETASMPV